MIVAITNLKEIPFTCKFCPYLIRPLGGFKCVILQKEVGMLYDRETHKWEYNKVPDCPLKEIKNDEIVK